MTGVAGPNSISRSPSTATVPRCDRHRMPLPRHQRPGLAHPDRRRRRRARSGRTPCVRPPPDRSSAPRRRAGRCGRSGAAARRCWTARSRAARRTRSRARAACRAATAPSTPTWATVDTHTSTSAISWTSRPRTRLDVQHLGAVRGLAGRHPAGGQQPGRGARDGRLPHLRERVVGAGGQRQQCDVAARRRRRADRAVAAEQHDHGGAALAHRRGPAPGCPRRSRSARRSRRTPAPASVRRRPGACARPAATPPATPIASVDISTRSTPVAPAAASSRSTMFVFSALGKTEACATSRRMSRPDIGFATMPTVEPGTIGSAAPGAFPLLRSAARGRPLVVVDRVVRDPGPGLTAGVVACFAAGRQSRPRDSPHRGTGARATVAAGLHRRPAGIGQLPAASLRMPGAVERLRSALPTSRWQHVSISGRDPVRAGPAAARPGSCAAATSRRARSPGARGRRRAPRTALRRRARPAPACASSSSTSACRVDSGCSQRLEPSTTARGGRWSSSRVSRIARPLDAVRSSQPPGTGSGTQTPTPVHRDRPLAARRRDPVQAGHPGDRGDPAVVVDHQARPAQARQQRGGRPRATPRAGPRAGATGSPRRASPRCRPARRWSGGSVSAGPLTSTTPSSSPVRGSCTGQAVQVQTWWVRTKCSAANICTGAPSASAVPIALLPTTRSDQLAPSVKPSASARRRTADRALPPEQHPVGVGDDHDVPGVLGDRGQRRPQLGQHPLQRRAGPARSTSSAPSGPGGSPRSGSTPWARARIHDRATSRRGSAGGRSPDSSASCTRASMRACRPMSMPGRIAQTPSSTATSASPAVHDSRYSPAAAPAAGSSGRVTDSG